MPVPVQIAVSVVWLVAYLVLSIRYQRVWDARWRAALGRRLGVNVGWAKVDGTSTTFTDSGDPASMAWHADTDGPLLRQLGQGLAVRAAYLAVIVIGGALPPLALIGAQLLLDFHALVLLASLVPVIAIFSIFWVRTYRRPSMTGAAAVLIAVIGLVGAAPPARAAAVTPTFGDECGLVNVSYSASESANFTISVDGVQIASGSTVVGSSTTFSVAARAGQVITLSGALTGAHTHASGDAGCVEPTVAVKSYVDRCDGTTAVNFHNSSGTPASGYVVETVGPVTQIPALPPGDSEFVVADGRPSVSIRWGKGLVGLHTYRAPAGCGTSNQLSVSYVDRCGKLEWTVRNGSATAQTVELVKASTVLATESVPAGESASYTVSATEGMVVSLRQAGSGEAIGSEHVFQVPAVCVGLPATGTRTVLFFGIGAGLVVLGGLAFFLSRRKRSTPVT